MMYQVYLILLKSTIKKLNSTNCLYPHSKPNLFSKNLLEMKLEMPKKVKMRGLKLN